MPIVFTKLHTHLAALCLVAIALTSSPVAVANEDPNLPTTLEVTQLPTYCRSHFRKEYGHLPGIPQSCGTHVNHFCQGLVSLNRAGNYALKKSDRQRYARLARGDIDYTKNGLEPSCFLVKELAEAESRLRVIELLSK